MTYDDFKIGEDFWLNGERYRCLDIAGHHIIAVALEDWILADMSWLNGPPYALELEVFDAYDWPVCFKTREAWEAAYND